MLIGFIRRLWKFSRNFYCNYFQFYIKDGSNLMWFIFILFFLSNLFLCILYTYKIRSMHLHPTSIKLPHSSIFKDLFHSKLHMGGGYVNLSSGIHRGQRFWTLWSRSCRQLWAARCGCWRLNPSPLQRQNELFNAGSSLQAPSSLLTPNT